MGEPLLTIQTTSRRGILGLAALVHCDKGTPCQHSRTCRRYQDRGLEGAGTITTSWSLRALASEWFAEDADRVDKFSYDLNSLSLWPLREPCD